MKRTIFVGSSHEGYVAAQKVCSAIKQLGDESLDPQLWSGFFDAGSLTFEALELPLCVPGDRNLAPSRLTQHSLSLVARLARNGLGSRPCGPDDLRQEELSASVVS